MRYWFRR